MGYQEFTDFVFDPLLQPARMPISGTRPIGTRAQSGWPPSTSLAYRLHKAPILFGKGGRPERLIARFWQDMAELDHLPRQQLIQIDLDGMPTFNLRSLSDRFSHELDPQHC